MAEATLEAQLEELLDQETFSPSSEFASHAVISDPAIHEWASRDPEGFWAEQAGALDWTEMWDRVLDGSNPPFAEWLGGKLNVAYNCVDRHVEAGRGDRVALHLRGEQGEERDVTNADLHRDVQRCANALKERGIGPGDVVGIYLPMIPQVKVAMLACARIGAPHNVVFGGFSPESVKERVLGGDGVDHGRRRAAQGHDGADQAAGRRGDERARPPRDDHRGQAHGRRVLDAGGPRLLVAHGA